MLGIKEDKDGKRIPSFEVFIAGKITYEGLDYAYKLLSESYSGIDDFIVILDSIVEEDVGISEVMFAALALRKGVSGVLYEEKNNKISVLGHAKHVRINGGDLLFSEETRHVINPSDVVGENIKFYSNFGSKYDVKICQDNKKGTFFYELEKNK